MRLVCLVQILHFNQNTSANSYLHKEENQVTEDHVHTLHSNHSARSPLIRSAPVEIS